MKKLISNALLSIFMLLTIALICAGVGYSFDALPIKYVITLGMLWQITIFITCFWEEK
jgi:hypothetical protein